MALPTPVEHATGAGVLRRNNVRVLGNPEGRPMVFAHGFGCSQEMWRLLTPGFERDHRVVLYDLVGAGGSDLAAYDRGRYDSLHAHADDLVDILTVLDLRDAVLVAHSVSTMIAVLAAVRAPERVGALVLVGPSPRYINDDDYVGGFERADIEGLLDVMEKNYMGWANFLAPVVMKNEGRPELTRELEESFCSTDPKIARRFAEATFFSDNREDLAKVPVPSLIMQCSEDAIAPNEVGEYLHRHLPQSTLRVLEATGHCPHMSHPEETIRVIKEYLAPAA